MSFSVDGWDPSYGASLEVEGQLTESAAKVDADVELPQDRWRPIDPDPRLPLPEALLFVDGVRRVEAQVWINADVPPADPLTGEVRPDVLPADGPVIDAMPGEPTPALCASYAAGAVCCCAAGAHLVISKLRRGLFSTASHASSIRTRAGGYQAHHVTTRQAGVPVVTTLSASLQRELAEVEKIAANEARGTDGGTGTAPTGHPANTANDLLVLDGPLRDRDRLPRALGYIKSHYVTYLSPELNGLVGTLGPGQRTPAFLLSTTLNRRSLDRHSWYLRLPCPPGAPWAGVVRLECAADLPIDEVTRLAGLSQRCLGKFASAPYKDSRAPQNLYPIAGLERELRRRLGDPQILYRALREAAG
jgi:hypothetical protein